MSEEKNPYEGPQSPVKPQSSSSDRIPFQQMAAYAVGMLANNLQAAALPAMMIVLNLGLGSVSYTHLTLPTTPYV